MLRRSLARLLIVLITGSSLIIVTLYSILMLESRSKTSHTLTGTTKLPAATLERTAPLSNRPFSDDLINALDGPVCDLTLLQPRAFQHLAELTDGIETERDIPRLSRMLVLFNQLSGITQSARAPKRLRELLVSGDRTIRALAIEAASRATDSQGRELWLAILRHEIPLEREFVLVVVKCSGNVHSPEVTKILNEYLDPERYPSLVVKEAISALKYIGDKSNIESLEKASKDVKDPHIRQMSQFALQNITILQSPNRDELLLGLIDSPVVSGSFSWAHWSIDHIVIEKLNHLVPRLRVIYEVKKDKWPMVGQRSLKIWLLNAIHRLGGQVNAEEEEVLRSFGRIP